jgi:hypothetical protein
MVLVHVSAMVVARGLVVVSMPVVALTVLV